MSIFSKNPSGYEGGLSKENKILKDHLRWCIELIEEFPIEPSHGGPCSPPATNCDGACADAYYFNKQLDEIRKIIN